MSYSDFIKQQVRTGPRTLGARLGRWAVKRNMSVIKIAQYTGASRTTVYSWFAGKTVSNAYHSKAAELLKLLEQHSHPT